MIWKYFTKRVKLILFFCFLFNVSSAQDIHHPTICECALNSAKDTALLRKCNEKFNYEKMLSSERNDLDWKIKQCKETNPCYCWHQLDKDPFLKEACDEANDTSKMDKDELKAYQRSKKNCDTTSKFDIEFKDVCECVNLTEGDREYVIQSCRERFNLTDLSPEEQQKVVDMISVCMEKGQGPDFYLDVCSCINADPNDNEMMERCLTRFHPDSLQAVEVIILKEKAKECLLGNGNLDWDLLCDCIRQTREGGNMPLECEEIGKILDEKMKKMSSEEQSQFFQRLMECGEF